jgi:hypothetical protein
VWLEVVKVYPPSMKDLAVKMGKEHGQTAVADLAAISRGDWDHALIPIGEAAEDTIKYQKLSKGDHQPVFMLFDPDTKPDETFKAVQEVRDRQAKAKAQQR